MRKILILLLCTIIALQLVSCSSTKEIKGQFYDSIVATDSNGNVDTYYSFRSNDDKVWWCITADELGFVPKANTEYVLVYDNNGTTKANKPCDCAPKFECECEVYDDILLEVKAND